MVRIFVEGQDDENIIIKLLQDLAKDKKIPKYQNFSSIIIRMNNKSKLLNHQEEKYEKTKKQIENKKVKKVLFIFDCDFERDDNRCGGLEKSQQCFEELKSSLNWNIPVDAYIFDKNLDYFLLETINDNECYSNFKDLTDCLGVEQLKPNKKPIANLYRDLYPKEPFDFSHPNFDELKEKLINLFK